MTSSRRRSAWKTRTDLRLRNGGVAKRNPPLLFPRRQKRWVTPSANPPYESRQPSQLPRIGKRERTHPPRVSVQDQGPRDRRLGALAAILALAEPAIDADRRALGFVEIHAGRIDQF